MSMMNWSVAFLGYAREKLTQNLAQVERCGRLLTDEDLWHRPNAHTNSVGNLVLHLMGNVRQWILGGLRGDACDRDRPAEFAARAACPRAELLADLSRVVLRAEETLRQLDTAALERPHRIQGYDVTGLVAVFHVVEHFSFHTGQIVHITKLLKDVDLSLYDAQGRKTVGAVHTP